MAMSDELRALLADPRTAGMLRERADRVLRTPVTIFTEGDILGSWVPVIGPELARELLNTLAFSERLDKEEFALVGELALIAEDCYRAWSAEVDTDGAEWRQVQWSYTERNDHRSMLLHVGRWDGELVQVRTSGEGLSRLIRRLCQAQAEWAEKGGKLDASELERASTLLSETLDTPQTDTSD
jgi:hypothetical protein